MMMSTKSSLELKHRWCRWNKCRNSPLFTLFSPSPSFPSLLLLLITLFKGMPNACVRIRRVSGVEITRIKRLVSVSRAFKIHVSLSNASIRLFPATHHSSRPSPYLSNLMAHHQSLQLVLFSTVCGVLYRSLVADKLFSKPSKDDHKLQIISS